MVVIFVFFCHKIWFVDLCYSNDHICNTTVLHHLWIKNAFKIMKRKCLSGFFTILTHAWHTGPVGGHKETVGDTSSFASEDKGDSECCRVGTEKPEEAAKRQWIASYPQLPVSNQSQRLAQTLFDLTSHRNRTLITCIKIFDFSV